MNTKVIIIIAAALVLAGITLFVIVMAVNHWDFSKLSTANLVTNNYTLTEDFQNISMQATTADIVLRPSEDGNTKVVCKEYSDERHEVTVEAGALTIRNSSKRKWYKNIGFHFGGPKITVYLPAKEYRQLTVQGTTNDVTIPKDFQFETMDIHLTTGDIVSGASTSGEMKLGVTTGDIILKDISAGSTHLSTTTGDILLTNVTAASLESDGNTGGVHLTNVLVSEKLFIHRTTGDVVMKLCDAGEIEIKVTTGDVRGSLRSEKIFSTSATTGDVNVPQSDSGGICKIKTTTGDIDIKISK